MGQYCVSAIIQNEHDEKAWLYSTTDGVLSIEKAMEIINHIRANHRVLSAWIDIFYDEHKKHTIFHKCYINVMGDIKEVKENE